MKYLTLLTLTILLSIGVTGCTEKQIILIPQTEYYPTFDTSEFNVSKPYTLEMWVETEDINGTTQTYLVADKDDMLGLIKYTKELRIKYNVLLKELNKFNKKVIEINEKQNQKKPKEVDSINNSWFK